MSVDGRAVRRGSVAVIGIGNRYRGDDGAGLEAVRRIALAGLERVDVIQIEGEPTSLLDAWGDSETVFIVDAVTAGGEPGTVYRFDARTEPPPAAFCHRGTHAFSVADVVELAAALDQLPSSVIAYGIEGAAFDAGEGLSPEAERGVEDAVLGLLAEIRRGGR
jgi:hydrogenase maturation protease